MESAIHLRYRPLPYVSKVFDGASARPSRFHLRFNHATPVSLPHFSTPRGPITRSFGHATCMLERFSEPSHTNKGSGNKILRGMTGASLVLACVLGLLNFSGKMNPKFTTAYAIMSPDEIGTGKGALDSLLNIKEKTNYGISDIDKIKSSAIREVKPITRQALELIKKEYEACKKINSEQTHNLGLALVEGLMFQGSYNEANKKLDEQIKWLLEEQINETDKSLTKNSEKLADLHPKQSTGYQKRRIAQLILYKAIVAQALQNKKPLRDIAKDIKNEIERDKEGWTEALKQVYGDF